MALPTPTSVGFVQIPNRDFELGAVDWTTNANANIVNEPQLGGAWCVKTVASGELNDGNVVHDDFFPVVPGMNITLTATGQSTVGTPGTGFSAAFNWYDSSFNFISQSPGAIVNRAAIGGGQGSCSVNSAGMPGGAAYVKPVGSMNVSASGSNTIYMDNFSWNYSFPVEAYLSAPGPGYTDADEIPARIVITGLPGGTTVTSVAYWKMTWDGATYITPTLLSTQTVAPYAYNAPAMADGRYAIYAIVTLSNGVQITTNSREFEVSDAPPSATREYRASNSTTLLVGENFSRLGSALPANAIVTGTEVVVGYDMLVLVRSKDLGIPDPEASNSLVAFDIVNGGTVEAVLLDKSGSSYSVAGSQTANVPINVIDFTVTEEGTSEDKKWTVYNQDDEATVTVGGSTTLFGQASMPASTFLEKAVGLKFSPNLLAKPSYADSGDAAYRFKVNTFKVRVYFDAGSVEYYFANPAKTNVIKGELAAGYVETGDLTTGGATGSLQLLPTLEVVTGVGNVIGNDWTIHSANPPTAANQIGVVNGNMVYNGLPTYEEVEANRSRYVFITANFYGDTALDSIYGANGVDRAFAYNGEFFYKIQSNPELAKDNPRHVAFHHTHLALGFGEGRVDLSVVGEPYNFDGADGASSWAIGDSVVGLLPLSGAILGIFCKKSIVGLSGTTVDNFATQTLSPNIGAVEYTITDMGFPVYANAYGIYTLSQTEEYGDYLGAPMSQMVSPWLRPRLIRKATSDKEVVVAWPVRSKNQYKLAFSDGYVLTMTMNYGSKEAPTFSKQKYFYTHPDHEPVAELTAYQMLQQEAMVPAAISSELDDGDEERIHIAPKVIVDTPSYSSSSGGTPVSSNSLQIDARCGFENGINADIGTWVDEMGNPLPDPAWLNNLQDNHYPFKLTGPGWTADFVWDSDYDNWKMNASTGTAPAPPATIAPGTVVLYDYVQNRAVSSITWNCA